MESAGPSPYTRPGMAPGSSCTVATHRSSLHGRNASKLEKVYDEIEALQGAPRPSIAVMDLGAAGSDAYTSLADSLADEFGRLDGLVNNAGIALQHRAVRCRDVATGHARQCHGGLCHYPGMPAAAASVG
jgi:NADP-dependent 3-hydroxy acid dehydrogenase YdfG